MFFIGSFICSIFNLYNVKATPLKGETRVIRNKTSMYAVL